MKSSFWKAGAAATAITPSEPMWLAGWAARREPASGAAMDLFARALALEDPEGRQIIILTADLIAIPRFLSDALARRCGVARERLLCNASHTHCGPEVRPDKAPFFEIPLEFAEKIPPYLSQLEEKMAAVLEAARKNLQPAVLRAGKSSADFARNRRVLGGPVAHDVPVLSILCPDQKPLAILFGYACHNLTLPPSACRYHGDYAGVAARELETQFPGAVALFLAGAGADQDPEPRGAEEMADAHGQTLARAVNHAIQTADRTISGSLGVEWEDVALDFRLLPTPEMLADDLQSNDPPRVRKAKFLNEARAAKRVFPSSYPCPVQVLRFGGELALVALGGEPVVDYALRLQSELAGPMVWVAGYSNDMFGYLPSRRVQAEGGYESERALLWSALPAPFTDTVEERIIAATRRLAGRLGISYTGAT